MGLRYLSVPICVTNERLLQKLVGDLFRQFVAKSTIDIVIEKQSKVSVHEINYSTKR